MQENIYQTIRSIIAGERKAVARSGELVIIINHQPRQDTSAGQYAVGVLGGEDVAAFNVVRYDNGQCAVYEVSDEEEEIDAAKTELESLAQVLESAVF